MVFKINMHKKAATQLTEYLAGQGLKSTTQRDSILQSFVQAGRHVSAEELYGLIKKTLSRDRVCNGLSYPEIVGGGGNR